MNITKSLTKTISAVGSVGEMAADVITGVSDLGSSAKNAVQSEIETYQYERDLDNASNRIKAKVKAIKEIQTVLGCTFLEAEELLDYEMKKEESK